ncbi:MAG: hypothetical protein DI598_12970 [Pseudopedobacter saltans]|uniref:Uncharacterized protein n=1 Tax=Pseudopedobacter saltans TaxID=151895 RepID=A0A2W5EQY9_9SPHI|nr:MAG: hypothetical protein DI598_12970 [Pseudopedobacter saltans]
MSVYQIIETPFSIEFCPFAYYKKDIKWYLLTILVLAITLFVFFQSLSEGFKITIMVILILAVFYFLKDALLKYPVKYKFDASSNTILQSTLFRKEREIMALDEMVIIPNSNNNGWHYAIGKKKQQFVKSFSISPDFGSGKKSEKKAQLFELEILDKIRALVEQRSATNLLKLSL